MNIPTFNYGFLVIVNVWGVGALRFLPVCGCVSTTVWMHHLDANEMHGEKAGWELHKNATWFWTTLGSNTAQSSSCAAIYLSSHKASK